MNKLFLSRSALILLTMLFSFEFFVQESHEINKAIFLRGKAFTSAVIEDAYFQNWNIGVEYRFAEKHSIGLDFVHFRWRYEEDIYIDGYETGSGPDSFSRRRYLLADYRYYLLQMLIKEKHIDTYLNPLVKLMTKKIQSSI